MNLPNLIIAVAFVAAVLLALCAGIPALAGRDPHGTAFRRALAASGVLALAAALGPLLLGRTWEIAHAWNLPNARLLIQGGPLGAAFLLPLALSTPLLGWYLVAYDRDAPRLDSQGRVRFCFGLAAAAMMLLTHAANAVLFLMAWEAVGLAGYFLVMAEDAKPEVREAGWVYLVASHAGALMVLAGFALLAAGRGTWDLGPLPEGFAASTRGTAAFLLLAGGFALKAGLMPFHVWLPGAHASAPSPVSALLSGLVIKMGLLGLARLVSWTPLPPLWWGAGLLALGALSGVIGLAYALAQRDLKRLLAYSSVENVGVATLGLGLACAGKTLGRADLVVLGGAGALFHILNHALFKPLLFLGAGSVLHATGTRDLEALGGLMQRMPRTGALFLLGAAAIAGLPPLNGFAGEWLLYLGSLRGLAHDGWAGAFLPVAALVLIGGLAVAAFSRAFGIAFLGEPRSEAAAHAHEASPGMLGPMGVLAGLCLLLGLAPILVAPALGRAAAGLAPERAMPALRSLACLPALSLVAALALPVLLALGLRLRRVRFRRAGTWDCGYAAPTARIQYTASSFGRMIVDGFRWALGTEVHPPRVRGLFPRPTALVRRQPDAVLDLGLAPASRFLAWLMGRLHVLQSGLLPVYLLYVVLILVLLFAALLP